MVKSRNYSLRDERYVCGSSGVSKYRDVLSLWISMGLHGRERVRQYSRSVAITLHDSTRYSFTLFWTRCVLFRLDTGVKPAKLKSCNNAHGLKSHNILRWYVRCRCSESFAGGRSGPKFN